jgi:hypothetical protein
MDWLRGGGGGGAFKPLSSGFPPAAVHHQHLLAPRPAVGTDPRDSKHPLSVTQLTGGGAGFHHAPHAHLRSPVVVGGGGAGAPDGPHHAHTTKRAPLLGMT